MCMCGVQMGMHDYTCLGAHVCDCTVYVCVWKPKVDDRGLPQFSLHCLDWGRFSGWTWICSTASLASQLPRTPANEDGRPYPPIQVSLLYGQHLSHWARSPVCNCFVVGFWYPLLASLHSLSTLLLLASISHVYGIGCSYLLHASKSMQHAARACSICPAAEIS